MGMTAILHFTILSLKLPILLHKQAKWRFIVKVAVDVKNLTTLQYEEMSRYLIILYQILPLEFHYCTVAAALGNPMSLI